MVVKKPFNKDALRFTVQSVWKLKGRVIFKEVVTNIFVVNFQNEAELHKVQQGQLWTFDKYLLCFTKFNGHLTLQRVDFNKELMWAQLHDLPKVMMTRVYGERLRKFIRKIIEIDVNKDGVGWDHTFE